MNTGVIAVRYATALLKLTQESGRGEQVCAQVRSLLATPDVVPEPLEGDLEKFLSLLVEKGRMDFLKYILNSYVKMYFRWAGISLAHLTSAVASPELEGRIKSLLESRLSRKVVIDSKVDPSLIGGFVLEVDDYLMDASVARQIELIRREFANKNKRSE